MESYWVLGQRIDFLATGETTAGHYSLFHVLAFPRPARPATPCAPRTRRRLLRSLERPSSRLLFEDAWRPARTRAVPTARASGTVHHLPGTRPTTRRACCPASCRRALNGSSATSGTRRRLGDVEPACPLSRRRNSNGSGPRRASTQMEDASPSRIARTRWVVDRLGRSVRKPAGTPLRRSSRSPRR